jgi:hypothetical protein
MKIGKIVGLGILSIVLLMVWFLGAQSPREPLDVSLIQLIANSDKYDGKLVRVIGYLRLEFEGNALYLHQEDYEHSLIKNGIWVNTTPEIMKNQAKLNNTYVLLEGTFDAKRFGHMGLFSGEIRDIRRADLWGVRANADPGTLKPNYK